MKSIFKSQMWCVDTKLSELGIDEDKISIFLDVIIDVDQIESIKKSDDEDYNKNCRCWIYMKSGHDFGISTEFEIVYELWKKHLSGDSQLFYSYCEKNNLI